MKVGFIGGPGAGKSTTSAGLFTACKNRGITVELVQEYARDQLNRGWSPKCIGDQHRILDEQRRKEAIIPDTIDVLITDSPTILSYLYALKNNDVQDTSDIMAMTALYETFLTDMHNYDILVLLKRTKPYVDDGTRSQTAEESDRIHEEIKVLLDLHSVEYAEMNGDMETVELLIQAITDD